MAKADNSRKAAGTIMGSACSGHLQVKLNDACKFCQFVVLLMTFVLLNVQKKVIICLICLSEKQPVERKNNLSFFDNKVK